ncbi:MAG: TonB-dependent receptor [Brevundimonas sp.]|uniref:TonB-dependent receptor n=1 Tax=Brevundimonas sp. TaxID=1871086 RepID=UPI00391C2F59
MAITAMLAAAPALAQDAQPDGATEVEEVVVTGIRSSLRSSQAIKRDSEVFVDSITAEDIGALPDRSVTEALQRIPGVSIDRFRAGVDPDHFSIEGSGVVVRGLTWVRSELNGRDTFSATNGRGLSFQDVPSELMGGVDVFKNQSADMIEGGISGSINLRTRVPFDAPGRVLAGSIEGSYGDFAKEWTPTYSALWSDRFDTEVGEFGLLLNFVNSELIARSDGQQISNFGPRTLYANGDVVGPDGTEVGSVWFPRGAAMRTQTFERERQGYAAAGQWRSPDRTMVATAQFMRSDSTQSWTEYAIEIATDNVTDNGDSRALQGTQLNFGPGGVFTDGVITGRTGWRADQNNGNPRVPDWGLQSNNIRRDQWQRYITTDVGFNLVYTPTERVRMNLDYQFVDSTVEVEDNTLWNSTYQNASIELRGSRIPIVTFENPRRLWSGDANPDDPAQGTPGTPCNVTAQHCPNYPGFTDLGAPGATFTRSAMDHYEDSEGTLHALRFDYDYAFPDSNWIDSIRFGVRGAVRDQTTRFSAYNWGVISEQWGGEPGGPRWLDGSVAGLGALADYHSPFDFGNFMRGQVPVPTGGQSRLFWNTSAINDYQRLIDYALGVGDSWRDRLNEEGCQQNWVPAFMRCDAIAGTPFLPQEINPMEEITRSAYGMLRFRTDLNNGAELSGNVGLRYTRTDRTTEGFRAFTFVSFPSEAECAAVPPDQAPPTFCTFAPDVRQGARNFANGSISAVDTRSDYDYWLPSLNVRLRLDNGLQFRFGASRAITPPDVGLTRNYYNVTLSALAENVVDGEPTGRFTVGNPYLKPILATNFDASVEYYFADVGQLTFSVFYKRLEDVITNGATRQTFTNNGSSFDAVVTQPTNSDDTGSVRGFEVAYQQTYDFLPSPWDGLGLNANYTFVDSDGVEQSTLSSTDPDVGAGRVANVDVSLLPLQGLSEHTANLAVFYEKGPVSARLAYSWRSEFLVTTRDVIVPYAPIMQEDTGQLDGSFFYTLNDNWKLGVQGVNLTNEITRTSQVLNNDLLRAGRSWFMNDRRFTVVLRASF